MTRLFIIRKLPHYTTNFTEDSFVVRSNFLLSLESVPAGKGAYILPLNLITMFYHRLIFKKISKDDIAGYLPLRCKLLPDFSTETAFRWLKRKEIISAIVSNILSILRCGERNYCLTCEINQSIIL